MHPIDRTLNSPDTDRFPLRASLRAHVDDGSLLGEVARVLHTGPSVAMNLALQSNFAAFARRVSQAGARVSMPPVAALRLPAGGAWVEVDDPLERFGLFGFTGPGGGIHVRRVTLRNADGGGGWCSPISLGRLPVAEPPMVDWAALGREAWPEDADAEARWSDWADKHLGLEALDDGLDAHALGAAIKLGLRSLVALALAVSPLSLGALTALLDAPGHSPAVRH